MLGRDDQCNRKNGKEATEEHEKLFIRPPSVQSLPTLSSSTTSNSSITSFVASNQTFTSSLSSSQRIQGDQSLYLTPFWHLIIISDYICFKCNTIPNEILRKVIQKVIISKYKH